MQLQETYAHQNQRVWGYAACKGWKVSFSIMWLSRWQPNNKPVKTSLRSRWRRNCLRTNTNFERTGKMVLNFLINSADWTPDCMLNEMSTLTWVRRSVNLTIGTDALSSTRIECCSAMPHFWSSISNVRNGNFSQRPMTTKSKMSWKLSYHTAKSFKFPITYVTGWKVQSCAKRSKNFYNSFRP